MAYDTVMDKNLNINHFTVPNVDSIVKQLMCITYNPWDREVVDLN